MSTFHDQIQHLVSLMRPRLPHIHGEEATKQSLVLPFLACLGYDVYNPTEVQPEYTADFAKKRVKGQSEKVDYAIHREGVPVMFIECKALNTKLEGHSGQLARYFNTTPGCPLAILTDGISYKFYSDLEDKNILSEKPFFEVDLLNLTEPEAEVLENFTKDKFNAAATRAHAEEILHARQIGALIASILRSPNESFVRHVLGDLDLFVGRRVTEKVVEKYTPIVRRAIQAALLDMATQSLREIPELVSPGEDPPRIVTTPEELEALEIIREFCGDGVTHRDNTQWFTIGRGSPRNWFMRLYFDGPKKFVLLRLDPSLIQAPVSIRTNGQRVYIDTIADLHQIRDLVLAAFAAATS